MATIEAVKFRRNNDFIHLYYTHEIPIVQAFLLFPRNRKDQNYD